MRVEYFFTIIYRIYERELYEDWNRRAVLGLANGQKIPLYTLCKDRFFGFIESGVASSKLK